MYRHTSGWFIQRWISGMSASSTGRMATALPRIIDSSGRTPGKHFPVDPTDIGCGALPGEPGCMADRPRGQPGGKGRVREDLDDPVGEVRGTTTFDEKTACSVRHGVPEAP